MEIIVPYDNRDSEIPLLESRYPGVRFFCSDSFVGPMRRCHEHFDRSRAIGLSLARSDIVAMLEDHERPDKYWAKRIFEAHRHPYAAIGGAVENGIDRPLNWAVYFCDFGKYQNPVKEGTTSCLSDVNISYKTDILFQIKDIWRDLYHEPLVNGTLMTRGEKLWISPDIVVYQSRADMKLISSLIERYVWGYYYAGNRVQQIPLKQRLFYLIFSPLLPLVLISRKGTDVIRKRKKVSKFIKSLPLIFLLLIFWSIGEFTGYFLGRPSKYQKYQKRGLIHT